jgi:hypothetical protein
VAQASIGTPAAVPPKDLDGPVVGAGAEVGPHPGRDGRLVTPGETWTVHALPGMASMRRSLPGELGLSSVHLIDSQLGPGRPRLGPRAAVRPERSKAPSMASMASEVLTALRAEGAKSVASSQGSHPSASQRTVLFDTSGERLSRSCPTILSFVQMLQTGTMVRTVRRRPDERTVWAIR